MLKNAKQRICDICGSYYNPITYNQRYCSECQRIMKTTRAQEYREETKAKKAIKTRTKPRLTWPEVIKICNAYGVTYGKAMTKGLLTRKTLDDITPRRS